MLPVGVYGPNRVLKDYKVSLGQKTRENKKGLINVKVILKTKLLLVN